MTPRIARLLPPFLFSALVLGLAGCGELKPKVPGADEHSAQQKLAAARRLKAACGSAQTYDRLKALTFDEVAKVRSGASGALDAIAANSTIRMEQPRAKSRDEALDITVCEGHLVLDLPPGLQDSFNGNRRLEADVEYSAQQAADGSGLVYEMQGAEPIIYRLAALMLPKGMPPAGPAVAAPAPVAIAPAAAPPTAWVANAAPLPRVPATRSTGAPPARAPEAPAADRPAGTARPSFSCSNVRSSVLRMVCSDPRLAAQDRRMSSAFYAALASGDEPTRAELRSSRDRFISFRNRCGSAACVSQAYEDRMAEIRDIASGD